MTNASKRAIFKNKNPEVFKPNSRNVNFRHYNFKTCSLTSVLVSSSDRFSDSDIIRAIRMVFEMSPASTQTRPFKPTAH